MPANKILEIACFNIQSALIAQASGADRIELCEDYAQGGLTPSIKNISEAAQKINIPLHVIIRPRGGDFVYSADEVRAMEETIAYCKANGIAGVVLGVLTADHQINVDACKSLVAAAKPMAVTFHRAIDACADMKLAFTQLLEIGISRVLTSGRAATAEEGLTELKIVQKIFGSKMVIMPGGGVRSSNISALMASGCNEFHSAAITGSGDMADAGEIKKLKQLLNGGSL